MGLLLSHPARVSEQLWRLHGTYQAPLDGTSPTARELPKQFHLCGEANAGRSSLMKIVLPLLMLSFLSTSLTAGEMRPREDEEQECRTGTETFPSQEWTRLGVGEALYRQGQVAECLWALPKAALRASEAGTYIQKGTYLWNAGGNRYCVRDGATRFCFIDKDGDGDFDKSTTMGGGRGVNLTTPYEKAWVPSPEQIEEDGRREELILLAVEPTTLRASMREYAGDLTTPRITSEVSFPVQGGTGRFTFKGQVLEVRPAADGMIEVRRAK